MIIGVFRFYIPIYILLWGTDAPFSPTDKTKTPGRLTPKSTHIRNGVQMGVLAWFFSVITKSGHKEKSNTNTYGLIKNIPPEIIPVSSGYGINSDPKKWYIPRFKIVISRRGMRDRHVWFSIWKKMDEDETNIPSLHNLNRGRVELTYLCGWFGHSCVVHWATTPLPICRIIFMDHQLYWNEVVIWCIIPSIV